MTPSENWGNQKNWGSQKQKVKIETKNIFTKSDLEKLEKKLGFEKFREWAKTNYNTTDRSKTKLIEEILEKQGGKE